MSKDKPDQPKIPDGKSKQQIMDVKISQNVIQNMVYVLRGQQVMMDSDLAMLYKVETRALNQAVKRNIARFPEKFCFQITAEEYPNLISQIVMSNLDKEKYENYGGRRTLPYVFNEQGIAMLSAVLRSETAIQISIRIMETFVELRKYIAGNAQIYERINQVELRQSEYQKKSEERFEQVFDYIADHEEVKQKIFFDGQIYDAFSLLVKLVGSAKKSIVLVDNYVDVGTLNILAKKRDAVSVCIYTMKETRLTATDVKNFNKQYPELEVKYTGAFHDRFLIVDEDCTYHIGASLKDAGRKCFAINLLEDVRIVKDVLRQLD